MLYFSLLFSVFISLQYCKFVLWVDKQHPLISKKIQVQINITLCIHFYITYANVCASKSQSPGWQQIADVAVVV